MAVKETQALSSLFRISSGPCNDRLSYPGMIDTDHSHNELIAATAVPSLPD